MRSSYVKVSGDCYKSPRFLDFLRGLARETFVVVCIGGGTQINAAMQEAGFPSDRKHGPMGRELATFRERQLARNVLELNQVELQDLLEEQGIPATVTIPVIDIGTVLCHVNGDQMVETAYLGFDALYVITTKERSETKTQQYAHLPKVKIVPIEEDEHTSLRQQ